MFERAHEAGRNDGRIGGPGAAYALVGGVERAISLAKRETAATVHLFQADWDGVDQARRRIVAAGLGERITARHIEALRAAGRAAGAFRWAG